MNPQEKLSVCLFSDPNFMAVNILENLLSKNCVVSIVTNSPGAWKSCTRNLSVNSKFNILERKNFDGNKTFDYAIFCGGFLEKDTAYADYTNFVSFPNLTSTKTIALFPLETYNRESVDSINISSNTAVIFVGDLLGARINIESDLLIARAVLEIVQKRRLTLAVGEVLYPLFVANVVKIISKWLFSFGPYGKMVLFLGNQTSGDTFWSVNQKLVGSIELCYDTKISPRVFPKGVEKIVVDSDLSLSLNETYKWLSKEPFKLPANVVKKQQVKPKQTKPKKKNPKTVKRISTLIIFLLIFPFITLFIGLIISFVAYKNLVIGKFSSAQNSLLIAQTFAAASEKESGVLSYVPALGLVYKEVEFADVFTEEADNLGNNLIPVIKDTTQLLNNILGSQVYDSTNLSLKIESETGILYGNVLSIKSKTENASSDGIILANKILNRIDFNWLANLVSGCKTIAGNAPQILGQNESKTYLVLFENNMELRPTGGFIGSFGLITFDGGRLSDLTVNDVYSADGQLNGHVEPPAPIKNYLGEANWWLRDSNWDPDFPTSAKRAEWFLDKELSKKVDGVLAIDLFPIKEILKNTGPVFLPDYNLDITSDNLYENIQNEVQNNSFLQTHQKASFLTALSRNLLVAAVKLKVDQELSLVKTFYDSLNGRHIQVYLHGDTTQSALSGLQWDGAVGNPSCGGDCYADTVGIVEANVGDNKSNYFIERSVTLNLNIGASQVGHKLILNLKNTANPALGVSGKYKNYVRLLMSSDASLVSVRESVGDNYQDLTPEITDVKGHKEVGVLVELLGGENKNIEFVWNSNTDNSNSWRSYMLYFRKQAGVENYPLDIDVIGGSQLLADTRFALTKTGTYSYNTTLTRDFFSRFSW